MPWSWRDHEFGLRLVGARAYSSNTLESGWIPSPMPGIYSGDERMKKYREWLKANSFEGNASLGGSFYSNNIDDYYLTPYDLGYGAFVKFDHDFIGREALEKIATRPHKVKVTLELNDADVTAAIASQLGKEHERAKYFDFPSAVYSMYPFDRVMKDGKLAGLSTWVGYSSNERKMLTLAVLDPQYAKPGTEVIFVWGEEGGGSKKPTVESHKQVEIRAVVCPVPYVASVRTQYADRRLARDRQALKAPTRNRETAAQRPDGRDRRAFSFSPTQVHHVCQYETIDAVMQGAVPPRFYITLIRSSH